VVSGDLRLPRRPAGRVRPSKAKPTSKVPWKGRRARRGTAATSHPIHLLPLPEGPTTRRIKTRSFSAAGGLQSDRANPIPGEAIFWQKLVFFHFLYNLHIIIIHILHILHIFLLKIQRIYHFFLFFIFCIFYILLFCI
jgi:hypothetical protein